MKFPQIGGASIASRSPDRSDGAILLRPGLEAFNDFNSSSGRIDTAQTGCNEADASGLIPQATPHRGNLDSRGMDVSQAPPLFCRAPPWAQAQITSAGWKSFLKRAIDIVAALVLIVSAGPFMLLIAAAIKCSSSGPVIFRQERIGQYGKVFFVFKFRTMYAHMSDPMAARQTSAHDERITPLGKILRVTSLDELPQFFNVLLGDMSLVGPRPHALGTSISGMSLEVTDARYPLRHLVRPGITGWAQINGSRGALVSAEHLRRRLDHDLDYVQKFGPALDMWIMLRTLIQLLSGLDGC